MKPTLNDLWYFVECLFSPETKTFLYRTESIDIESFAGGACRGFLLDGFIYLSQNPNKNSHYGKLAREGKRIVWVINNKTSEYLGRIVDGKVEVKVNGNWILRGQLVAGKEVV